MDLYERFQHPSSEFTTVPFWFWNGKLEPGEITRQLELMHGQHISQCIIHARYGLETPYFSEEWFACIAHAIREGKRLGMRFWLYDENNWPSGYAGGRVLAENPDYCGKHLQHYDLAAGETLQDAQTVAVVAAFCRTAAGWERVDAADTGRARRVFVLRYTHWKVAYGSTYYIDLLNPAATGAFLRLTHEEYARRFGADMGETLLGFFSDEAGFCNGLMLPWSDRSDDGSLVWSEGVPAYFARRNGYDLVEQLPHLFEFDPAVTPRLRRDFQQTVCAMYREYFFRPQRLFCERYGMKLIGHLHYEDYLHLQVGTQGNFGQVLSEFSYAGLDRIEYAPGAISERLVSSIARQHGMPRVLSETFAQSGWDCAMQDMRRWTDFQLVRGVNLFVIHAFFYDIADFRKTDAPPSFFFQSPAYPFWHCYADYTMRLCGLLTAGQPRGALAVYYPIASCQAEYDPANREPVRALDRDVNAVVRGLEEAQYDCCLVDDDAFADTAVSDGRFAAGQERFAALAVIARYLPYATLEKIAALARQGIPVAFLRHCPRCIEAEHRDAYARLLAELLQLETVGYVEEYYFYRKFTYRFNVNCLFAIKGFREAVQPLIRLSEPDEGIRCYVRECGSRTVYFIVNENSGAVRHTVTFPEKQAPARWDALTGARQTCAYQMTETGVSVALELPAYSSAVYVLGDTAALPPLPSRRLRASIPLDGMWTISVGETVVTAPAERISAPRCGGAPTVTYTYTLRLERPVRWAVLRFAALRNVATVEINGEPAGEILWQPYRVSTDRLHPGENHIRVTVYTTAAGALGEPAQPYGVDGPVLLDVYEGGETV